MFLHFGFNSNFKLISKLFKYNKMKKIILSLVVLASIVTHAQVKVKGSDTVLPIGQKEAEEYMKAHKGENISVTGGGSGVGIAALIDNTTDIASSSRKIKL